MLARIRRSTQEQDQGFTLIELLIVMVIIGILAAVAIPAFNSQRAKAYDTATKSDVSNVAKVVAAFYVDGTGALTLDTTSTAGSITVKSGTNTVDTIKYSSGVQLPATPFKATAGSESSTWCVALSNSNSGTATWHYSAGSGLATGACP